ncbi:MAG: RNA polymerase sigma factor RpoD/SigA [Anaerolineales bacterium]
MNEKTPEELEGEEKFVPQGTERWSGEADEGWLDLEDELLEEALQEDPVRLYLREISQVPLLTADQEFRLAARLEGERVLHRLPQGAPIRQFVQLGEQILQLWQGCTQAQAASPQLELVLAEALALQKTWQDELPSYVYAWLEGLPRPKGAEWGEQAIRLYDLFIHFYLLPEETATWLLEWTKKRIRPPALSTLRKHLPDEKRLETHLAETKARAEDAYQMLIRANLRLVVSVARHYIGRGLPILDLIQEGNLGLLRGIERFDPHKGYRLSTYVTWWIRQAMGRTLAQQARLIRLPVHLFELTARLSKIQRQLTQELGREPTPEEIALEMDFLSAEDAQEIRRARLENRPLPAGLRQRLNQAIYKVEELMHASEEMPSLDVNVGNNEDSLLEDFVEDENAAEALDEAARRMLREQIQRAFDVLTERERQVLELRYGLIDGVEHTLEEISRYFNITRERVRQVEARALRKLRHPLRSKYLRDFLG